jgi:hypothetical protein
MVPYGPANGVRYLNGCLEDGVQTKDVLHEDPLSNLLQPRLSSFSPHKRGNLIHGFRSRHRHISGESLKSRHMVQERGDGCLQIQPGGKTGAVDGGKSRPGGWAVGGSSNDAERAASEAAGRTTGESHAGTSRRAARQG